MAQVGFPRVCSAGVHNKVADPRQCLVRHGLEGLERVECSYCNIVYSGLLGDWETGRLAFLLCIYSIPDCRNYTT
jgi:hypothetical protein